MITAFITTNAFYTRISSVLTTHLATLDGDRSHDNLPPPVLDSLNCTDVNSPDTHLQPRSFVPRLLLMSAPWIDLTSQDPLIADISRQVLILEVQYAAFCGASNVIITGPALSRCVQDGLTRFARAIQEALSLAPFVQLHILMPMGSGDGHEGEIFNLASHAREKYESGARIEDDQDAFASWDAWNVIRSTLEYSSRVSLGKLAINVPSFPLSHIIPGAMVFPP